MSRGRLHSRFVPLAHTCPTSHCCLHRECYQPPPEDTRGAYADPGPSSEWTPTYWLAGKDVPDAQTLSPTHKRLIEKLIKEGR